MNIQTKQAHKMLLDSHNTMLKSHDCSIVGRKGGYDIVFADKGIASISIDNKEEV